MLDEDNDFYNFLEQSSLATKFKAEDMTECIGNIILTDQFFFLTIQFSSKSGGLILWVLDIFFLPLG